MISMNSFAPSYHNHGIIGNCTPGVPSFPPLGGFPQFPQAPSFPGGGFPGAGGFGDGFSQFPGFPGGSQFPSFPGGHQFPGFPGGNQNYGFNPEVRGQGTSIDLNRNGRYNAGDAVLAFDFNRDGKVSHKELQQSRARMQAFGGNFDLNRDGKTTFIERIVGRGYQKDMQRLDTNRDGKLNAGEFAAGGGRVLVDTNRDGWMSENFSPFSFPTPGFGTGSIGQIDPFNSNISVRQNASPWGGGFGGVGGGSWGGPQPGYGGY